MLPSIQSETAVTRFDWLAIGGIALAFRLALWATEGVRVVGDASYWVTRCDDLLIAEHILSSDVLYSGFFLPYCGFVHLPGGTTERWILVQIVLSSASCILLYQVGRRLVNRGAGIVAGTALALTYQGFHYVTRPQSEAYFTVVAVVALWALVVYRNEPSMSNRLLALGCLALLSFTRPNGVALVAGYLLLDLVVGNAEYRLNLLSSRAPVLLVLALFAALAFARFRGALLGDFLPVASWTRGIIVTGHVTYEYSPRAANGALTFVLFNLHHVLAMAALRALWFFVPVLSGWSLPHIVINLLTVAPLTAAAVISLPTIVRRRPDIATVCVPPIAMTLLVVMLIFVPGPRKYLGPVIAVYGILAGYLVTEHPLFAPARERLSRYIDRGSSAART